MNTNEPPHPLERIVEDAKHHCHWSGCNREVPPKLWGCPYHWYKLPIKLRTQILKTYVPGQEITKTPSAEYIAAAIAARQWIANYEQKH